MFCTCLHVTIPTRLVVLTSKMLVLVNIVTLLGATHWP